MSDAKCVRMKHALAIWLLVFSFSFSNAEPASGKDDRTIRFKELEAKADEGYSWAQCSVGKYYQNGTKPVSKDYKKAEEYFLKSANQKNVIALGGLAQIWASRASDHDPENVSEWIKWVIIFEASSSSEEPRFNPRSFPRGSVFSESSIAEGLRRAKEFKFSMQGKGGYQVIGMETPRGVCKKLGLTEDQFKKLNPGLDFKSRLTEGQVLTTK